MADNDFRLWILPGPGQRITLSDMMLVACGYSTIVSIPCVLGMSVPNRSFLDILPVRIFIFQGETGKISACSLIESREESAPRRTFYDYVRDINIPEMSVPERSFITIPADRLFELLAESKKISESTPIVSREESAPRRIFEDYARAA